MSSAIIVLFNILCFYSFLVQAKTSKKILCLHGGGGNKDNFKNYLGHLEKAWPDFEFVYANAAFQSAVDGGLLWMESPPHNENPYYGTNEGWQNFGLTYDRGWADYSINDLEAIRREQGPFYGILGFSQGAAFIPVYLSRIPSNSFQVVITFCGYLPLLHLGLMNSIELRKPFAKIPALIWMGRYDSAIANHLTEDLATVFHNPTIVLSDDSGHEIPQLFDRTISDVTSFVYSNYKEDYDSNNTSSSTISRMNSGMAIMAPLIFLFIFL